jgi:hypothetical protein
MAGLPPDHLSESTSAVGVEEVGAVLEDTLAGVAAREGGPVTEDQSFEPGPNVRARLLVCLAVCSLAPLAARFSASLAASLLAARIGASMCARSTTARCLARAAVHFVTLTNPDGFSVLKMTS